ncbi:hypothetical protein CVIRNUC_001755 [Coccomyxa viridis]|uniref:Uncharacterized protein n=1 Tax=Coccomyxa viridis TaxID=1274662 RepID=A0AAV1HWG9_9CHLO|nr:hypothetical protein CVIRNUC_001755 [Coccomyxa viridis]
MSYPDTSSGCSQTSSALPMRYCSCWLSIAQSYARSASLHPEAAAQLEGVWPPSRQQVEDNELTTDVLLTRWRSLMASERRAFCWDLSSMRQAVLGSQNP